MCRLMELGRRPGFLVEYPGPHARQPRDTIFHMATGGSVPYHVLGSCAHQQDIDRGRMDRTPSSERVRRSSRMPVGGYVLTRRFATSSRGTMAAVIHSTGRGQRGVEDLVVVGLC